MNRIFAAMALFCALAVFACLPKDGAGPALRCRLGPDCSGVGQVIGQTKYDAKVAKAGEQLAQYCGALRAVAMGVSIFAPEKHQALAMQAGAAVNSVCDQPPSDVASALTAAAKAYEAVLAAGKATGVRVQTAAAGA